MSELSGVSPPTPPEPSATIRRFQERIRDRHTEFQWPGTSKRFNCCNYCGWSWPCGDYSDAVTALALLDAAPIRYWERQYVDQAYAGVEMHGFNHTRGIWIADPNHPFGSRDPEPRA